MALGRFVSNFAECSLVLLFFSALSIHASFGLLRISFHVNLLHLVACFLFAIIVLELEIFVLVSCISSLYYSVTRTNIPWNTLNCPIRYLTIIPRARMGYWLRGHEGESNNCFSKIQLVGQKYRGKTTLASKTQFSRHCFGFQSRHFSLLVVYNIYASSCSTNQNAAFIIDHSLDFTT